MRLSGGWLWALFWEGPDLIPRFGADSGPDLVRRFRADLRLDLVPRFTVLEKFEF